MTRALPVCAVLLALPLLSRAQEKAAPTATVIRLKVEPAAAPKPALRYQLLPELSEMEPGNAILGYLKCFMEQNPFFFGKEAEEKRQKWDDLPLKDLPVKEMRADGYRKDAVIFRRLDNAARLDHADWQTLLPLRREGFNLLLPEVQQCRRLAWVLQLRLRADVAERQFDEALVTTKTYLAMARHLGEHPTVIGDLVGIAVATMAFGPLDDMLQQPGCPNLYWALTNLPDPLIDLRRGLQGERMILMQTNEFRVLNERAPMTDAQLQQVVTHVHELVNVAWGFKRPDVRLLVAARLLNPDYLRAARGRLIAYGLPADRLKQFPPLQVLLLDDKLTTETIRDEAAKALALPYWQAEKAMVAGQPPKNAETESVFGWTLFAVLKVRLAQVRLQQRIGLLRSVEALRMYAAEHEGRLPARLEDVPVPVPVDPVTGRPFLYSLEGATATLRGSAPTSMETNAAYNVRYEVTIAR
jgi:hypothetical protein